MCAPFLFLCRTFSDVEASDNALQRIGAVAQLCDFFIRQFDVDLAADAVVSDHVQRAEADVVDAVFAVHHGGNGHGRVDADEQRLADVADGDGDGVERRAFAGNDAAAGFFDILCDFIIVEVRRGDARRRKELC